MGGKARSGGGRRRDPFAMLERSHERLLEQLGRLRATAEAVARGRAGQDIRETLEEITRFLGGPTLRHEADEEDSFFPRLRGRGIDELLDRLAREHREHARLTRELAAAVRGPLDRRAGDHLVRLGEALDLAYRDHVAVEEARLLPAARELLSPHERRAILAEMQSRRGR